MLCACSGEQFKFEDAPRSPESLATRDFSASGLSSKTADWESKFEDSQVDEAESTLKEALSLNYEEARALLGRLEYQRGNFDAALQVFQGIDIKGLTPRMTKAIAERSRRPKLPARGDNLTGIVMSMHSVSLLLEAILLKAKSLVALGKVEEAARECKLILDTVESALPNGMPEGISEECKLQEIFHKALELLPNLWTQAGHLDQSITTYRRALVRPWNLEPQRLAKVQKDLASMLLYAGVEANIPSQLQLWGQTSPKNNTEEAILLLFILMRTVARRQIAWDPEIMDHLTYALTVSGQFEQLADHVEQALPGRYDRVERWYLLALCYSASGRYEAALNLLKKVLRFPKETQKPHLPSFLMGAKLCSLNPKHAHEGVNFARAVIDSGEIRDDHFIDQAHMLLGICFGTAARASISDSQRMIYLKESLISLTQAARICKQDPEIIYSLGLENAFQRNIEAAFENVLSYCHMVAGSSERGWKLLALIMSAEKQFEGAEAIVDTVLGESGGMIDELDLLRLKAVLQIAQEQPKQAMETYKLLLAQIEAQRTLHANNKYPKALPFRNLETEAWQDLALIYIKLGSWSDAGFSVEKAKSIQPYSPANWHTAGILLEAKSLYKEALVSFSISLSIEPDYVPSIVSAAKVLIKLGNGLLPIARSFLLNALRLDSTNYEAWFNLGLISEMDGLIEQAADFFQAAFELKESAPVQSFV